MNDILRDLLLMLGSLSVNEGITAMAFYSSLLVLVLIILLNTKTDHEFNQPVMLKVAGVLLVSAVVFSSNNSILHLVAVFIFGTLITKLDFLENIAAIIKGSAKDVLESRWSSQTVVEKKKEYEDNPGKIDNEMGIVADSNVRVSAEEKEIQLKAKIAKYLEIEELALNYVEKLYGDKIERRVVIEIPKKSSRIELDGLISQSRIGGYDVLIEVKYTSSIQHLQTTVITQLSNMYEQYKKLTNKDAVVLLLIVSDKLSTQLEEVDNALMSKQSWFPFTYKVLSQKQIGYVNNNVAQAFANTQ